MKPYKKINLKAPLQPSPLPLADAYAKAAAFCAYQERTRQQVREKLHEYGLTDDEAEDLLDRLVAEKFVDDERFARAFAGGKFRLKKWGRIKIRQELKMRGLSGVIVQRGLDEIDPDAYTDTLQELLEKKNAQERGTSDLTRKQKLLRYALSKGYEQDLIWDAINALIPGSHR